MLVDTSVWVDHLRQNEPVLALLLERLEVECHPFIVGELALGSMQQRSEILTLLHSLPQLHIATHDEVLAFVDRHKLAGSGIGWVDAHLLASAAINHTVLWTKDKRLSNVAEALSLRAHP